MNSYTTHTKNTPRATNSGAQMRETMPLGPMEHLLHKNTPPRLGDVAELPNTEEQAQRVSQNEETKK